MCDVEAEIVHEMGLKRVEFKSMGNRMSHTDSQG